MKQSIILLFLGILLQSVGIAQGYRIDNLDVEINISPEGFAQVHEHYDVFFEKKKRGIIRSIPYAYQFDGKKYSVKFRDIKVPNEATQTSKKRGYNNIRIGEKSKYLTGNKSYDIFYDVVGPFMRSENYDEFYWNVSGNEWDTKIEQVSFTINLPQGTPLRYNDVRYFTGRRGENGKDAEITTNGNTITGTSTKAFHPGSGLTVAVKLPKGFIKNENIFTLQSSTTSIREPDDYGLWWALPATLFTCLLGIWKGMRPEYKVEESSEPTAYPPKGFSPAEVGTFIDNIAHNRDVLSLLPFWAFHGNISITRHADDELSFTKLSDLPEDRPAYEILFFDTIFKEKEEVFLSNINKDMYQTISIVKKAIYDDLRETGLYDARYLHWFKSYRILLVGAFFIMGGIIAFVMGNVPAGFVSMGMAVCCLILRLVHPPASERGYAIKEKLKNLKEHLTSDQIDTEIISADPNYFDRLFPFAFALGLEKSWTQRVAKEHDYNPQWYAVAPGLSNKSSFKDFTDIFTPKEIGSAFIQYPEGSSSGASGGFSGGSSGGGFGGGGGSSW